MEDLGGRAAEKTAALVEVQAALQAESFARRRTERELRAVEQRCCGLEEELREAGRQRDRFIAVLSHELRNPLTSILNSLQIMERAAPGGDQARRAKAVIARQAGQMARLVDDLLDAARITQKEIALQMERLDLNELVRRAVAEHQALFAEHGVALAEILAPRALFVKADGARLAQAIGRLLDNAAKFTQREGRATISVSVEDGTHAGIRIADTGVGFMPEALPRLFLPFMKEGAAPDRSCGGLGLGLTLAKGLIELHGGSIEAYSAGIGKGAEFSVRLPLDLSLPAERPAAPAMAAGRQRKVLIIEDNVDLAESLRELMEMDGHEVAVSYNGPDGLLKACEFEPEILLCDIGLPGMDGYAVAQAFRADEKLREVYLVALTGYAQAEDQQKAAEAGFHQHLAKPPEPEALARILMGMGR